MAYSSGTINPASARPNDDVYAKVAAALGGHAAWALVEDYTDGTGNKHHVWRCKAANSGLVRDFYVTFTAPFTDVSGLYSYCHEGYTTATHTMSKYCPLADSLGPVSAGTSVAADGTLNATWPLGTPAGYAYIEPNYANSVTGPGVGGTCDYWIVVSSTGVHIGVRVGASSTASFAGSFDTLVSNPAVNDAMPLVVYPYGATIYTSQTPAPSAHKIPLRGGQSYPYAFAVNYVGETPPWTGSTAVTNTAQGDLYQGGAALASRLPVLSTAGGDAASAALNGWLRGLLRDVLYITPGSGLASGDTITINGHVYVHLMNGCFVDTQAA